MRQTDYVVVGAGSAGCALAARLTEDPSVNVTVLEAGGPDTLEGISMPAVWPTLWGTEVDWAYETTPQRGVPGRCTSVPEERCSAAPAASTGWSTSAPIRTT